MDVTTSIKFLPNVYAGDDDYEEGFDDNLLINKDLGECFMCPLCFGIPRNPVVIKKCGHCFCEAEHRKACNRIRQPLKQRERLYHQMSSLLILIYEIWSNWLWWFQYSIKEGVQPYSTKVPLWVFLYWITTWNGWSSDVWVSKTNCLLSVFGLQTENGVRKVNRGTYHELWKTHHLLWLVFSPNAKSGS